MAPFAYLLDTNILLRLPKPGQLGVPEIKSALGALYQSRTSLYYTSQNLIEFWNVLTRPADRNGYGLSVVEADREARRIEKTFRLLPDTDRIHHEWRKLVVAYSVSGVQVHDARLVAYMKIHGIDHLLTLNGRDFARYTEITALHPSQIPV